MILTIKMQNEYFKSCYAKTGILVKKNVTKEQKISTSYQQLLPLSPPGYIVDGGLCKALGCKSSEN